MLALHTGVQEDTLVPMHACTVYKQASEQPVHIPSLKGPAHLDLIVCLLLLSMLSMMLVCSLHVLDLFWPQGPSFADPWDCPALLMCLSQGPQHVDYLRSASSPPACCCPLMPHCSFSGDLGSVKNAHIYFPLSVG